MMYMILKAIFRPIFWRSALTLLLCTPLLATAQAVSPAAAPAATATAASGGAEVGGPLLFKSLHLMPQDELPALHHPPHRRSRHRLARRLAAGLHLV